MHYFTLESIKVWLTRKLITFIETGSSMIDESMDRSFTYYSNFFIDIVG